MYYTLSMILFLFLLLLGDVEIKETYNFGEVLTSEKVAYVFIFKNDADKKIFIRNVRTTDHLELLSYPQEIEPKGLGEFAIILDATNLKGNIKRGLNIDYEIEGEKDLRYARFVIEGIVHLPVEAKILKEESKFYTFYPDPPYHIILLNFYSDKVKEYKIERIAVVGEDKMPFKKEIIQGEKKNEFKIKIQPENTPQIGEYTTYVGIKTNVPDTSEILLPIYFNIKSPFSVSEERLEFNLDFIFNRVKLIKDCYFYSDFEMKKIYDKFINSNYFILYEESENKSLIGIEGEKFWVLSDCIERIKPTTSEKRKFIYLSEAHKKPFKIVSSSLESKNISYFFTNDSPSSKTFILTLSENAKESEETKLIIETDYTGFQKIVIPISIKKE